MSTFKTLFSRANHRIYIGASLIFYQCFSSSLVIGSVLKQRNNKGNKTQQLAQGITAALGQVSKQWFPRWFPPDRQYPLAGILGGIHQMASYHDGYNSRVVANLVTRKSNHFEVVAR